MCDPLTLTSAALLAGGTAANYYGQTQAASARDDVLAAERIRQRGYDKEADALNRKSQGLYENFGDKQAQTGSDLQAMFRDASAPATTPPAGQTAAPQDVMPSSTSNIVNREQAKQQGLADAFTGQQADALGSLRSFGELMGGNSREQAKNASLLSQILGFKTGSSRVAGLETEQASHAGDGWSFAGDVARGLGSLGMTVGLSGGPLASSLDSMFTPKALGTGAAVIKQGGKLVAAAPGAAPYVIY